MEEKKRFSIEGPYMAEFLRGFGTLIGFAQDPACSIPDDTLYAIDCVLQYFADDVEQFAENAWKEHCELNRLRKITEQIAS